MKISKTRLLQIIREEVELREKTIEENTFELDEVELKEIEDLNASATEKPVATDKNGNVKNPGKIIDDAADGKMEEETTAEDQIIKKGNGVIKPKPNQTNRNNLEIKIR